MPLVINTNVAALNSQRQLVKSGNDTAQAMERLASGRRINTAADDAAGLAISNRQTSQIRGLDQAIRNANDGVSLIQTAEGGLDEVTNILQRMRELSIQSSNGIYSDVDRSTLDAEVQQLKSEMDRIASSTTFNGQPLLDGSLDDVKLQVGSEANQTIDMSIPGFSTSSLGSSSGDIVGEAATGLGSLTVLGGDEIVINDVSISSLTSATTINEALSTINADLDGKGAEATTLVSYISESAGSGVLVPGSTLTLTLTDGDGAAQTYNISNTGNMDELVERINSDTIIDAKLNEAGKLVLSADGAQSIQVQDGSTGQAATGASSNDTTENYRLVLTDTGAEKTGVKVEAGTGATSSELLGLGLNVQDDNGNLLGGSLTATASNDINSGDLIINGVDIGNIEVGTSIANDIDNVIIAINKLSDDTGVVAFENPGTGGAQLGLRSADGDSISIKYGDGSTGSDVLALTGLQEQNSAEGSGSVSGIDISTAAGAQSAIDVIDLALEEINATRSELGAINNRLDFTMSNLANVSEKTSAARSRIVDADFAAETSMLSRSQVLQQASQAMLAQANAAPQQVLQLLQG
ncbi:MAG: flagellin [Flavobacteriales bacterium]|jgi:flagellin